MKPFVSVIIPCFNEEKFIPGLMENIIHQDYPSDRMEIFFVDGMSTDQTCEKVESYTQSSLQVKLLNNPRRYVPFALNTGIRESKGEVIIRMDAHSEYPLNYISRLVWYLYDLDAGNVGGVWNTRPANDSNKAVAIAAALSTAFGIGTPEYRLGSREIKQVDTVPYGCFRRELFDAIGMFDEDLLRNQDDEFNARIIRSGRSVYLIPDLVITYFARGEVAGLFRTYFQYGFFKPLVNFKLKRPATFRQFAPPVFVLILLGGWIGFLVSPGAGAMYVGFLALYTIVNMSFTVSSAIRNHKGTMIFFLPWIFFLIHFAYGWGYLRGIVKWTTEKEKPVNITSSR